MSREKEMEGTAEEEGGRGGGEESRELFRDECNNNVLSCKKLVFASNAGEKAGNQGLSCRGFQYSRQLRLEVDGSGSLGTMPRKPQDADYTIPPLTDEVEALILARVPRSEYPKFCTINKRFYALLKSGGPALEYTCCPDPTADDLQWQALEQGRSHTTRFIINCSVMAA
ncbi:hypothetical protein DVH24_031618 [Malus domestica]|uniref:F-box domain-containing protein n=1 Tax=Malus domestica TaxID=3750 RepID=A0A498J758_MALDO|nr:hypothetical protein DVH24_031618 [Malus domestica]